MAGESKSGPIKERTAKTLSIMQDSAVAAGRFATNVQISGNTEHWVLSFIAVDPLEADDDGQAVGHLVGRIFMAPEHTRRFSRILAEQVVKWDEHKADPVAQD